MVCKKKTLVRTSLYDDKFIALQPMNDVTIYFQPENGHNVEVGIYLSTGFTMIDGKPRQDGDKRNGHY